MPYLIHQDTILYYETHGRGTPILLLHGNGEDCRYFDAQLPALTAHGYRVIRMDTRGHGRSGWGKSPLTFTRFAADAAAVLDACGETSAHLLGFSDGGNTAILFALQYPQRVRSLILNGANLTPAGLKPGVRLLDAAGWAAGSFCGLFSEPAKKRAEIIGLMVTQPQIKAGWLEAIHAPALVVAGQHDMILRQHTEEIARRIPGAKLKILPGADHFLAARHPAQFNRMILSFLEEAEQKR